MRAIASALLGLALLFATGCSGENDPAETGKGGWRIPAGVYGNVELGDESGDLGGIELFLDRGSESEAVEFVLCEGWCGEVEKHPLRRGLNGVSFAIDHGGRTTDILVGPAGPDAVELSVDWGNGLESYRLPRIAREFGLEVARGEAHRRDVPAVDAAPPMPPAPPVPSSPPPLPSPTP